MAKRIALTGNIGSGKTTVAQLFERLGIPVFVADQVAKKLMAEDTDLRRSITQRFGPEAYTPAGRLNRNYLASRVFDDEAELQALNALVHPAVAKAALTWHKNNVQDSEIADQQSPPPYTLHEAAITLEIGAADSFDALIVVTAPESIRLQRVMARDEATEEQIRARMARQWPEERKVDSADYLIHNDGLQLLWPQILAIHRQILNSK